jgi:nucleotide-binding universal stress UspA family protein
MYKKIMVPLDGSELAECVLPHLEGFIAGLQVSSIACVRVVEPSPTRFDDTASLSSTSRDKMIETTRRIEEKRKAAAAEYLEGVMSRLKREGVEFETEVLVGRVADSLADYTETKGVDLILIGVLPTESSAFHVFRF